MVDIEFAFQSHATSGSTKLCPKTRLNRLRELLTDLNPTNKKHLVLGDMNIDILKKVPVVSKYMEATSELGFTHLIKQPTRGRACLDHILCGGVNYRSVQIAEVPLKTDHKLISIDVGRSSQPQHISVTKIILPPETVKKLDIPPLEFSNLEDDIDKFIEILSEIKK